MLEDNESKKNNPYELPYPVYMQALWLIKDYNRMQKEYEDTTWESRDPMDGLPTGNKIDKPTERLGIKRAMLSTKIKAIENGISHVPEEYRKGILGNIINGKPYPMDAHRNTYTNHKRKLLYTVAENLSWI